MRISRAVLPTAAGGVPLTQLTAPAPRPAWYSGGVIPETRELDYLQVLKQQSGGNKTRAAVWAGVSRQAIQKLVRKHDIDWNDAEPESDS